MFNISNQTHNLELVKYLYQHKDYKLNYDSLCEVSSIGYLPIIKLIRLDSAAADRGQHFSTQIHSPNSEEDRQVEHISTDQTRKPNIQHACGQAS